LLPLLSLQALQARFIEHIKARKTVALDELAAEFGMKTQEAIQRLQMLEEQGRLTGVMDDRGKVGGRRGAGSDRGDREAMRTCWICGCLAGRLTVCRCVMSG